MTTKDNIRESFVSALKKHKETHLGEGAGDHLIAGLETDFKGGWQAATNEQQKLISEQQRLLEVAALAISRAAGFIELSGRDTDYLDGVLAEIEQALNKEGDV